VALIFHKNLDSAGEIGLWKIEEDEKFFVEQMDLLPKEEQLLLHIKGHRRLEWLASRWLLHLMSGRQKRGACLKDEFGKPYLENSFYDISISHSREYVTVMAAPHAVGIDIQKMVSKIESIVPKFLSQKEQGTLKEANRLEHLHVYWGAKEALYKAYGRKKLDFKQHILIEPFNFNLRIGHAKGRVHKDEFDAQFEIRYEQIGDYILVYATEIKEDDRLA